MRRRRSELAVPANNARMVAGALGGDADLVFLDLEDAVPETEKAAARVAAIEHLRGAPPSEQLRAVRVNAMDTAHGFRDVVDLVERAGDHLDVVILPKATSARGVWWVSALMDQLERAAGIERPVGLEILIEEVEGLIAVEEIARASSRIQTLIFGAFDFAASQGIDTVDIAPGAWDYARNRILHAARAAGLDAIDCAHLAIEDAAGLEEEALASRRMGFAGKWAIHPGQVEAINRVFTPSGDELARARRMIDAYEESSRAGRGAIRLDGQLVDAGTVRIVRNVLERARAVAAPAGEAPPPAGAR